MLQREETVDRVATVREKSEKDEKFSRSGKNENFSRSGKSQ